MALSFDHAAKRILVPQAEASPLLIQTLINAIRAEEASERGITYDQIADASGKESLGGSVLTGITLALRSTWKLEFAAGAYQATIDGGNLSDALNRVFNTGNPQVLALSSAAATLVETGTSGLTPSESATLMSIAADVLAALNSTTIPVDVQKMNGAEVIGDGTEGNPWRGVGVPP